ncbi:MAG: crosslink repair DNA glycosylase YcaQ family protein [Candidatus Limnocylindrales bacterium]
MSAPSTDFSSPPTISLEIARRLAVRASLLTEPRPGPPDRDGIMTVVRGLSRLQIDPTRAVERTHALVLWSRLGPYDQAEINVLLWDERRLFEYDAWILPVESYPEQAFLMSRFATRDGAWERRVRAWLATNDSFRRVVLDRLAAEGPLPSSAIKEPEDVTDWESKGWTGGRNVSQMFELLGRGGEIMIAGRSRGQRLWDLPAKVLPGVALDDVPSVEEFADQRVLGAVQRLGFADERAIRVRVPYLERAEVSAAIARQVADGSVVAVRLDDGAPAPVDGYVVAAEAGALDTLAGAGWRPRTTLLSPFDPLIKDRERTEALFGFHYRMEIYVPKGQRKYGYFVLPILHGDRLIGRIDPVMNRRTGILTITAVHVEDDAPIEDGAVGQAVGDAIRELATFLRADSTTWGTMPDGWRPGLAG